MHWSVDTIADTAQVAKTLLSQADETQPLILALTGDLGAGKTTFTQQLAELLGISEAVTSPTFVIMKYYDATHAVWHRLIHIDAYRIETVDEMQVLGLADLLKQKHTILCIEWANRIATLLPPQAVQLQFTTEGTRRTITQTT